MRWRLCNPADPIESHEHAMVLSRIDKWWKEFERKAKQIDVLFRRKSD